MRKESIHQRFLLFFLALTGAVAAPGCGDSASTEESEENRAAGNVEQTLGMTARGPCPACAPPFVERLDEVEFSGQLIVRPVQHMAPDRDARARSRIAPHVLKVYPEVDEYVIGVPAQLHGGAPGAGENRMAADLMASGDYEYVTPNWIAAPVAVPNDPLYGSQWHHPKIQAPEAWNVQKGSASMILAFTDTGIDTTHPDLAPKRVPGFNAVSDLAEVDGGDVSDVHGHGTHVAGCAAAIGNNGTGVSGVGWNFKLMMVRVTNRADGYATLDDRLQGARWAANHGAKVISTSYEGVAAPSINTTGQYIKNLGALYLWAAGNYNENLNWFDHPDVIVVGASTQTDGKASFSSYGPAIDVFAPGVSILSTLQGGMYGTMNGTSMATPIANGVVGMMWSVDPTFTPAEVEGFLFSTADDLGAPGEDATFGWGRVNVWQGVEAAREVACTHDKCAEGIALGSGCEPCTTSICAVDPYCCNTEWDAICVQEVMWVCSIACD